MLQLIKRIAAHWMLGFVRTAESGRKPLVWMDTETSGFNPKTQEILSLSMLDEAGTPLIKHPRTGKPLHEVRLKAKKLENASAHALNVNKYPAWRRFMAQNIRWPDGQVSSRQDRYPNWRNDENKHQVQELEDQWKEYISNPSAEELEAQKTDEWSEALDFEEVADQIADLFKTHRLAGHNVAFDRNFVESNLRDTGHNVKADPEMVDTMALSWMASIPSNRLETTAEALGIPLGDNAHGAYPDTEASRQVWEQLRDPEAVRAMREKMRQEYGGPSRGVVFTAMETTGNNPWRDQITSLAIVDQHGRTMFNANIGEGEGQVRPEDAVHEIADIYEGNMFGGPNPTREADFIRSFIRNHSPKREDGKAQLGFYSPVLDTATLRHVYGVGKETPEGSSLLDRAKAEADTLHQIADKTFGESQPHRNPKGDFESWANERTFGHPMPKNHPSRKKDFITFSALKSLARSSDPSVASKASQYIEGLRRNFENAQQRSQRNL